MNQEVPQPATATRSPGAGSRPDSSGASAAARRQQAGCEAISCSVRAPAVCPCVTGASVPILNSPLLCLLAARCSRRAASRCRRWPACAAHIPASPVAATERMK